MTDRDQELEWIKAWPVQKHRVMEQIYKATFRPLWTSAYRVLQDSAGAEDMVQEVMLRLWQMDSLDHIGTSLRGYLHQAVLRRSLNRIRDAKRLAQDTDTSDIPAHDTGFRAIDAQDLEKKLAAAIENLPERCRVVFVLCRFEHLSHKEVAELMDISVKTVENQMTRALRILRDQLRAPP